LLDGVSGYEMDEQEDDGDDQPDDGDGVDQAEEKRADGAGETTPRT
jgi:hypothetical protein